MRFMNGGADILRRKAGRIWSNEISLTPDAFEMDYDHMFDRLDIKLGDAEALQKCSLDAVASIIQDFEDELSGNAPFILFQLFYFFYESRSAPIYRRERRGFVLSSGGQPPQQGITTWKDLMPSPSRFEMVLYEGDESGGAGTIAVYTSASAVLL
jgi:hypothetical protein